MAQKTYPQQDDRLIIHQLADGGDSSALGRDVRNGLTQKPKHLPPKYFYDELGSRLFEAICCLPEYYLTRAESQILRERSTEIATSIANSSPSVRLIELGSGSAEKTRLLIEAFLRRQTELHYLPVDISPASLQTSSRELLRAYPKLRITAYAADYFTALEAFKRERAQHGGSERTVALFLGSNIGNFDPDEAVSFLSAVRELLDSGDAFLLGADLKKSPDVLIPAYDDSLGVTAAFNLNLLVRINRELRSDFKLEEFEHRSCYNEALSRVEMHLVSRIRQTIRIGALDLEVEFEPGESVHTESSYKYDLDKLGEIARRGGFKLSRTWFDAGRRFSFNLLSVD
ncbi:MAG TPA: L-histidine N(alpha)-methyltransferase [Blastocatellia bacterium]|nr:L-histidine N(alpha)-methyltransferase [Blastocatellia bacterium]